MSVTDRAPARREYHSIQVLRGIAAMAVVLFHLDHSLGRFGVDAGWLGGMSAGVDVFFVISGFIMVHTVSGRDTRPGDFLIQRARRIVPLYWAVTLFMALLLGLAPGLANSVEVSPGLLVGSLLFLPVSNAALNGARMPLVVPGWTLNLEMFFYLLFAVGLWFPARLRTGFMALALAVVVALATGGLVPDLVAFWGQPMVFEFLLGMILAGALRDRALPNVPAWAPVLAAAMLFGLGSLPGANEGWLRLVLRGGPALLLVASVLALELRGQIRFPRLFHLLGDASYSIYLVHGIVLSAFATFWMKAGLTGLPAAVGLPLFALAAVGFAALGGVLVWRFFERPVDRLLRHVLSSSQAKGFSR